MGKWATAWSWLHSRWRDWEGEQHWPYFLVQLSAFVAILWWFGRSHLPWPGVAVSIIAVLAALMSIDQNLKGCHKAVYFVLMAALLVTEFRSMRKDRENSERQQQAFFAQQKSGFQSINDQAQRNFQATINQSQENFNATAEGLESAYSQRQKQFAATIGGISKSIDTITGGTSYLWVSYDLKYNTLDFIHKGNYPVYKAIVRIVNLDSTPINLNGAIMQLQNVTKGHGISEEAPPGLLVIPDRVDLNIFFNSLNGDWIERLRERRVGNVWHRFIRVEGYFYSTNKGAILCEDMDKGFPTDTLQKELRTPTISKLPSCAF